MNSKEVLLYITEQKKRLEYSSTDISDRCENNISRSSIDRMLSEEVDPKLSTVLSVFKVLDIKMTLSVNKSKK